MAEILVVDDAAFMRMLVKDILKEEGHTIVAEAGNGEEAIQKYSECKPDLVTMDIVMPNMTGIDAVRGIMKDFPEAKIVMCSALGQRAMVTEALDAGATDFIVKPFQKEQVKEVISKVIGSGN